MADIKLFNKWSTEDIEVKDSGLKPYISLVPQLIPRTDGRFNKKQFWKSKQNIVERFINKLMGVTGHEGKHHKATSGRNSGKSLKVMGIVEQAFMVLEEKTKKNPVEILVRAIENAAPACEITAVEYGGIRRPMPVDISPQRRVDLALRFLTHGAFNRSFRQKTSLVNGIVSELLAAYNNDIKCYSIGKKENLERQALASR